MTESIEKQYRILKKSRLLQLTPILSGTYSVSCQYYTDIKRRMIPYRISFECEAGIAHIWTNIQIFTCNNWGLFSSYTGITNDEIFHYRFRLKYYKLTNKWELRILLNSTSKKAYL